MAKSMTIKVDDQDIRELNRAIFRMEKASKDDLKAEVLQLAQDMVPHFQRSAQTSRQMALRPTVKAKKDINPYIQFGGLQSAGVRGGATMTDMLFGTEFGAVEPKLRNNGRAFPKRSPRQGRGNKGYWIFPTAQKLQPMIVRRWYQTVDNVLDKWVQ